MHGACWCHVVHVGTMSDTLLMHDTNDQAGAGLRLHLCCRCLEAGQPNPAAGTYRWSPLRGQCNPPIMTPASGRQAHACSSAGLPEALSHYRQVGAWP